MRAVVTPPDHDYLFVITRTEIKQAKTRTDAAPVMKQILEKF